MSQPVTCRTVALLALGPSADGLRVVVRPIGSRWGVLWQHAAGCGGAQAVAVGGDAGLYRPAEALPEMEPVSDQQSMGAPRRAPSA
ncbi:hypothetical protein GCM10020295_03230 [Streptomyces cinereospinus]